MNNVTRMPNQSSAGATLKTVLGTVNSVATAVGSTFDIVTEGVAMGHAFVENASLDQKDRHIIHRALYRKELKAEAGLRRIRLNDTVREYVGNDPNRIEEWKLIESEIDALFDEPETN